MGVDVDTSKRKADALKPREYEKKSAKEKPSAEVKDAIDPRDFYPPDGKEGEGEQSPAEEDELTAARIDDVRNYLLALQNPLAAPDVRKRIESKLEPLDFGAFVLTDEVRQEVPIIDGLVAVFRTLTGEEDIYVRSRVPVENQSVDVVEARRAAYMLAMGLYSLNGKKIDPWHLDENGKIDVQAVEERVNKILRLPVTVMSSLSVNFTWFQERVEMLLRGDVEERIKNG